MKFFIKFILVLIILIIISQLEYKGRKIQTYIEEYFRSLRSASTEPQVVEEEVVVKPVPKDVKSPVIKKQKKVEKVDIEDKDRKQLQELLED